MNEQDILQKFNDMSKNTLLETLDIEFTAVGEDFLSGKMPVTSKVHQPFGLLHGGASIVLAETLGSTLSNVILNSDDFVAVGQHVDANHLRPKKEGTIFGHATVVKQGRTSHLIKIEIKDENDKLICYTHLTNAIISKKHV
ncbi:hotdog fold thioesterase [Empedobacter brevis]|uniref:Hotdog fold thioesterase n=1 Tax=Empedobacter brevis TaxID=247 RepID=A0AAJ1V989_9FLAO|nr:hotdog fold thioesterase [Empedobacter brevis]MDM1073912.1 hotdog fold thioesterase [Empedobacter brevis]QHC84816.1 thioesterase [Empedobacter brevis]